jgi:hypothetical protein
MFWSWYCIVLAIRALLLPCYCHALSPCFCWVLTCSCHAHAVLLRGHGKCQGHVIKSMARAWPELTFPPSHFTPTPPQPTSPHHTPPHPTPPSSSPLPHPSPSHPTTPQRQLPPTPHNNGPPHTPTLYSLCGMGGGIANNHELYTINQSML